MRRLSFFGVLLVAVCLVGCSDLSRSEALGQIQRWGLFTSPAAVLIQVGRLSSTCYIDASKREYTLLSRLGLLEVKPVSRNTWDVSLTDAGKKALAGEPYAHESKNGCDHWQVSIPFATKENVHVTGIKQVSDSNAVVDFAFTWKLNELGKALTEPEVEKLHLSDKDIDDLKLALTFSGIGAFPIPRDVGNGYFSANFEKYDDGWRVKL